MDEAYRQRIEKLKAALLEYLGGNNRHYGDLLRMEQSVEDLAQALNTRLDQLMMALADSRTQPVENPRERLASRLMNTAAILTLQGNVDEEMASDFDKALDAFDLAADLKRQSETVRDAGETAAIKHKRSRSG